MNGSLTLDFLIFFQFRSELQKQKPLTRTHAILSSRICVSQLSNGQVISIRNILLAVLKCPLKDNEVQPSWCTITQREGHWIVSRGRFLNCLSWMQIKVRGTRQWNFKRLVMWKWRKRVRLQLDKDFVSHYLIIYLFIYQKIAHWCWVKKYYASPQITVDWP